MVATHKAASRLVAVSNPSRKPGSVSCSNVRTSNWRLALTAGPTASSLTPSVGNPGHPWPRSNRTFGGEFVGDQYRLSGRDFAEIVEHHGQRCVCVDLENRVGDHQVAECLVAGVRDFEAQGHIGIGLGLDITLTRARLAAVVAFVAGDGETHRVLHSVLAQRQRDGRKIDSVLNRAQLAPHDLEVPFTIEQKSFESGEVFQIGGTFHGVAQSLDTELGDLDAARKVDDTFGDIVGGDRLVAQLTNFAESVERFVEPVWTNFVDDLRAGLCAAGRVLAEDEPAEAADDVIGLLTPGLDVIDLDADGGGEDDVTPEFGRGDSDRCASATERLPVRSFCNSVRGSRRRVGGRPSAVATPVAASSLSSSDRESAAAVVPRRSRRQRSLLVSSSSALHAASTTTNARTNAILRAQIPLILLIAGAPRVRRSPKYDDGRGALVPWCALRHVIAMISRRSAVLRPTSVTVTL